MGRLSRESVPSSWKGSRAHGIFSDFSEQIRVYAQSASLTWKPFGVHSRNGLTRDGYRRGWIIEQSVKGHSEKFARQRKCPREIETLRGLCAVTRNKIKIEPRVKLLKPDGKGTSCRFFAIFLPFSSSFCST